MIAEARGEAETRAVAGEELWWPPGGSAGVVVTEQTALQYAALLATVITIATDTAILPLCVHQTTAGGASREAKEHGNYELLARSPNGEATPVRWKQSWMSHALIYGNGLAEIQRTGRGAPYALHLLDPLSTGAKRDRSDRLYYQLGNGRNVPAADVLHIAGLGFDGISGYNMVRLLRQNIGLGLAEETFAADFFSNGSESGGTIEIPNKLKDQAAVDRVRNGWEGRHQGAGRRHRVAILEEGAKFNPTSTDPQKSQLLDARKFQVIDLIRAWRLPPNKAGDMSEAHLANIEASNLDYLMTALMGWLVTIEQECDLKLFSRTEWRQGFHVKHDVNALLRGDIKSRFDSYSLAIRDGWMSRNEVRRRENMNPLPEGAGGDLHTVQMQIVPLTDEGALQAPAARSDTGAGKENPDPDPGKGDDEDRSELRMNANHGADGKFAAGHGGLAHSGGAPLTTEHADALRAQVGAIGAARTPPSDWRLEVRPPATPGEAKAVARAAASGRHLVRKTVEPKTSEAKDGAATEHRVGLHTEAVTRPHRTDPGKFVSETDAVSPAPYKKTFGTEAEALAHSRNYVHREVKRQTDSSYHRTRDVAREADDHGGPGLDPAHFKTTFHLITHDPGAAP